MALSFMLASTNACCTAKQIYYVQGCANIDTDKKWAEELKACPTFSTLLSLQDFKLFWGITTNGQKKTGDPFYEKLGFTPFVASQKGSRHPETGPLTMWTITPEKLKENYELLLQKVAQEGKPNQEELDRRSSFPEFALFRIVKNEKFQTALPGVNRLLMDDSFPSGLGQRRVVFDAIKDITGGFEADKDPVLVSNIRILTWRMVKDRAILYRKGAI